jgi:lysophospholipase L1-like esterase
MRPLLPILALTLTGCATSSFFVNPTTPINPNRDPTLLYYHALGDSITQGTGLGSPSTQAYPALLAAANALPSPANYASGGDQGCDLPTRQIFPNADAPALTHRGLYTILISSSDVVLYGTAGPHEATFNLCHQASIAWLGTPAESKLLASDATSSGPSHFEGPPFNALWTDAPQASLTFPLRLNTPGAVYIWYRIVDASPGTFTAFLDSAPIASPTTGTLPLIQTRNGTHDSLALLRIPTVLAGPHTLTFVQTSPGPSGLGIVAVGTPPPTASPLAPKLLVGTTPRQLQGGTGPCAISDAPCQAYIADITANVALLRSDGLNLTLFDSRKYESGTSADMFDSLHPNLQGHKELFQSIEDQLQ